MSVALTHDTGPGGPWAAVARFLSQYPGGRRAEALHLALQRAVRHAVGRVR
jgi:hypothetical protein